MSDQLALFAARRLAETTLEQRHAGAVALLEADELEPWERADLLQLVVAPEAVER